MDVTFSLGIWLQFICLVFFFFEWIHIDSHVINGFKIWTEKLRRGSALSLSGWLRYRPNGVWVNLNLVSLDPNPDPGFLVNPYQKPQCFGTGTAGTGIFGPGIPDLAYN